MKQLSSSAITWLSLIFEERFGHNFKLVPVKNGISMTLTNENEGEIFFPHTFMEFFESHSDISFTTWDAEAEGWISALKEPLPAPGVANFSTRVIELDNQAIKKVYIKYDILGLMYWMLNRIEEIGRTDLDIHDRFPAIYSHAYKYNYLERPIVDEWLYILRQVIQYVWPSLELKQHHFCMKVSHDVDRPSRYGFRSMFDLIKGLFKDLVIKKNILSLYNCILTRSNIYNYIHERDPANTFSWIMRQSEINNLQSTFYFISGTSCSKRDADYNIDHPSIIRLMKEIYSRGHKIGLHPSYNTYCNLEQLNIEANTLRIVMQRNDINQSEIGGRMHYLRWKHPITLLNCEAANLIYDTSLGYADRPGFRCGTCYEYPAFDHLNQKVLKIRLLPLIAMEGTIIDKRYLGLGLGEDAFNKFEILKQRCKMVNGCYTLLWHNTELMEEDKKTFYVRLIS